MTLLFSEIQRKKYKSFDRMAEEKAAQHVKTVKYIEGLARTASIDISSWDAKAVFGTGSGNELECDTGKINKLFFEELERIAAMPTPVEQAPRTILTEAQLAAIAAIDTRLLQGQVVHFTSTRDQRLSEAAEYYRNYETRLKQAADADVARRRLAGERSSFSDQIRAIDDGGFWEFVGMEGTSSFKFKTRNNINLEYKNAAIGADIRVNMGKFQAAFNYSDSRIRVMPAENNINVGGYYHPHINSSGEICWGTAQAQASNELSKGLIVNPFLLLAAVLTGYNSGSPYVNLQSFHELVVTKEEQMAIDAMAQKQKEAQVILLNSMTYKVAAFDRVINAVTPPITHPVIETVIVVPAPTTTNTVEF